MKEIYLKIIDSIIQITFDSEKETTTKKNLSLFYKNYTTLNKNPIDYYLYIKDDYKYSFLKKEEKAYLSFFEKEKINSIIASNTFDELQSDILMRIITHDLVIKKKMFIIHSSAILVNGKAIVFIGKSGIGKSTIVRMLKHTFIPLCDDIAIVKKEKNGMYYLYQAPYKEKNNYKKADIKYPIRRFYLLRQGKSPKINEVNIGADHKFMANICSEICVDGDKSRIVKFVFGLKNNLLELIYSRQDIRTLKDYFITESKQ